MELFRAMPTALFHVLATCNCLVDSGALALGRLRIQCVSALQAGDRQVCIEAHARVGMMWLLLEG